jgi:hypothetical protein
MKSRDAAVRVAKVSSLIPFQRCMYLYISQGNLEGISPTVPTKGRSPKWYLCTKKLAPTNYATRWGSIPLLRIPTTISGTGRRLLPPGPKNLVVLIPRLYCT